MHCVWNARVTDINESLITKLIIDVFHTTASCACACVVFENLRISLKYFSKSNFGKLSSFALISVHFQHCILENGKEKNYRYYWPVSAKTVRKAMKENFDNIHTENQKCNKSTQKFWNNVLTNANFTGLSSSLTFTVLTGKSWLEHASSSCQHWP